MDLGMRDDHWEKVWEVFNSAYERLPGQRSALLSSEDLDPEVRSEVLALLEVSTSCTAGRAAPAPPTVGPEYPVGHQLGRYMIVGLVGQGGFGRIYAAHDKDLRRIVALKVLAGPVSSHRDRLIEEARAATALNHPNIVTVYETLTADDHLAIVMEFVDGQSLRQILHDAAGPLPLEKVVRYTRQIAEALSAAHEAGITHRDVKPENILVRKDEYIKLVDFGLATHVLATSADTGNGMVAGTLRYISPEQLRGEAASPAADVFSLGLVLYEMAAGEHPFQGKSPLDTADAIATRQPSPPSRRVRGIPPAMERLVMGMLAKDPAVRPSTTEVVRSLERIAGESARRWSRRRASFAGAILAVAAVSTVAVWSWTRKPAPMVLRLDARPLTGEEGRETQPALSPDGRFIVYHWQSTARSHPVTLLREIGSDQKTILPITAPFAWLPDGRHIGFVRRGNDLDTLCTIGTDGTDEREILSARGMGQARWSPDGDSIVYVAATQKNHVPYALFLYSTRTRETRQLTFPPASSRGDLWPVISPDGKHVAFRRVAEYLSSDIFMVDLPVPGTPRQITSKRVPGDDLAWLSGGNAIISPTLAGSAFNLWLYPLNPAQDSSRLTEVGLEVTAVQSALRRNRLAWVSALDDTNIWSVPLNGGTPRRVISSAIRDLDITASSLGLLAFRSDRSGAPEIWISTQDGGSQKKATNLNGRAGSPRWSPDGRRLVFDSRRADDGGDVYLMDCDPAQLQCGPPVQLTDHPGSDVIPNWSADGSSVYFASQRTGQWQLWRVPAEGKLQAAEQMTTKGGFFATESADGKWLYFSRNDSEQVSGVWRKPSPGNSGKSFRADDAGEMLLRLDSRALATWVLAGHEIVYPTYGDTNTPPAIWAFDLETQRKRMIHSTGDVPLARGLAVSPRGTSVLFSQLDRWQSNIIIADYEIAK
jgi:serine/threonine protein kinase/Tol biopolymer transport system component